MIDPRTILEEKLLSIDIEKSKALLIAIEAGSSQAVVDRDYLVEINIPDSHIKQCFELVVKFYMGYFSDDLIEN